MKMWDGVRVEGGLGRGEWIGWSFGEVCRWIEGLGDVFVGYSEGESGD